MRLILVLTLALAACDDSGNNDCRPFPKALPQCVPGQYETAMVTDPGPCGSDPRCGTADPEIGGHCNFPGLACEFFMITIACDCDSIAHCYGDSANAGPKCPKDAGTD